MLSIYQKKGSTMKNSFLIKFILLAVLFFCQHLSFAQSDSFWQNALPETSKVNAAFLTDANKGIAVGQNTTNLLMTNSGADCGCTTVGSFVNPNKGLPPTFKADLTSPKGKYKLIVGGSGPLTLWVKLVSNNTTVYQTNVPVGSGYGFSPDDDRFLTTYSSSGVQMTKLVDLTTSPASQVWSSQVLTGSSRLQFSPNGDYLMYNAITAQLHTKVLIIDTRTGRTVYQNEFTFYSVPDDPGETHGMVTWGFSPDLSSRTFVYAWISSQNSVNFTMVNLEKRIVVKNSTISSISAYWQFSPCGDVLGLIQETSPTQIMVQLYKTASIQAVLAEQTHTLIAPILLSTTTASHIISVGGTLYALASNTAASACSNEFVSVIVPDTLTGGFTGTGAVMLNTPATGSAVAVSLSSSRPTLVTVPSSVTIPIGVKMSTFKITSSLVQSDTTVVITATATSVTKRDTLILRALKIQSLQLSDTVIGGSIALGVVTLNNIAPPAGIPVTFESDMPSVAPAPAGFTIQSGMKTYNFSFKTNSVMDLTTVTIMARTGNSEKSKTLVIKPASLDVLKLSLASVKGGNPVSLTISLDGIAPSGGAHILLSSSDPGIASFLEGTAIVRANEKSTSVSITTKGVASAVSVIFTATYRGAILTKSLDIQPADLSTVVNNPCAVCGMTGGGSTDITINLDGEAPPGGAVINLSSNNLSGIEPPASVTVPAGLRSIIAPLTTSSVMANTTVRVTAKYRLLMMAVDIVLGAAGKYSITDLGIPTGFVATNTIAINDSNAVLVYAFGGTSPQNLSFLWRNGERTFFSPPPNYGSSFNAIGSDINNHGHVTGAFGTATVNEQAFLWIDGIASVLPLTAYRSGGGRINDSDWILGFLENDIGIMQFIYREGNIYSLGSHPGATSISPCDINNKGQVAGYWFNSIDAIGGAFLWENGVFSDFQPKAGYEISNINNLNDSGYVVGDLAETNSGIFRAFMWRDGNMDILPLPPGAKYNFALGINNSGEIVGSLIKSNDATLKHYGMIYHNGISSDLNELTIDPTRCEVNFANRINNRGFIAATGIINGQTHAMLLTPPEDLTTGIGSEEKKMIGHLLGQNFPNPFTSGTTIPYFLPEAVHVRLSIIDMLGKEVETLVDEMQLAGDRSAEFQAEHLRSGVYFYRLKAGTYTEVKKLLLIR
jgi:hypothetical protein